MLKQRTEGAKITLSLVVALRKERTLEQRQNWNSSSPVKTIQELVLFRRSNL
jgi:hypothetical protein